MRYLPGSSRNVALTITDTATGKERSFASLGLDQHVNLEDFGFRVTEIRPETEEAGAGVEIEYKEAGKSPQRFWIFADFPDYDFAHRKRSAQHFTLTGLRDRTAAELAVGREPGARLLWGGLMIAALLFWVALARPEERFWIRWSPSKDASPMNVEFVGWSARPVFFEPRFFKLASQLEGRITETERKQQGATP
jgi:hypothetical protein